VVTLAYFPEEAVSERQPLSNFEEVFF